MRPSAITAPALALGRHAPLKSYLKPEGKDTARVPSQTGYRFKSRAALLAGVLAPRSRLLKLESVRAGRLLLLKANHSV